MQSTLLTFPTPAPEAPAAPEPAPGLPPGVRTVRVVSAWENRPGGELLITEGVHEFKVIFDADDADCWCCRCRRNRCGHVDAARYIFLGTKRGAAARTREDAARFFMAGTGPQIIGYMASALRSRALERYIRDGVRTFTMDLILDIRCDRPTQNIKAMVPRRLAKAGFCRWTGRTVKSLDAVNHHNDLKLYEITDEALLAEWEVVRK